MKLFINLPTAYGPRVLIEQGLGRDEAYAVAESVRSFGGLAHVTDDGAQFSLRDHMLAHKKRRAKELRTVKLASVTPPNVTPIRARQS